jgi:hypothetical protein
MLLGASAVEVQPPEGGLAGVSPASCRTWTEPVLIPGERLEDLLWDHARPAAKPGPVDLSSGGKGYALIDAPGSPGQTTRRHGGTKSAEISQSRLAAPPGDDTPAAGSSDSQSRPVHQLAERRRRKVDRLRSGWRVLALVDSDGSPEPTTVIQGPITLRAQEIPPLAQHVDFEPARCDGEPVASWHEFDLSWPLAR